MLVTKILIKAYFKLDVADDTHVAVIIKLKKEVSNIEVEHFIDDFVMKL